MHPILRKQEPLVSKIENLNLETKELPKELPKEQSIVIKSTIEKTEKTINYEKINQIFNKAPSHVSVKPKNVGNNSTLKTNSSVLVKLNKIRGRR
jgi:hypothetical protein